MKYLQTIRRQGKARRPVAAQPMRAEGDRTAVQEALGYAGQAKRPAHAAWQGAGDAGPASHVADRMALRQALALPVSRTSRGEEEGEGPVSQAKDAGVPAPVQEGNDAGVARDAGTPLPGGLPDAGTPQPAPAQLPAQQQAPQPQACTVTTRTLAAAPDGSASSRKTVGVNEQVELSASTPVTWTASAGTLAAAGAAATWTAPERRNTCTITATPATGSPCSVSIKAVPPERRALRRSSRRSYTAGLGGSGFVADVSIRPLYVSFSRIEVREETVNSSASGYYDSVLGWNGISHPTGSWLPVNASNSGIIDTVGTNPPGSATPFSAGTFTWPIPQSYRILGSSAGGYVYSTGTHEQAMTGTGGAETTRKEGASSSRTP